MSGAVSVGTPDFRRINVALFCAGFVTFVTLYDVQPLLPLFAQEFAISPAVASLPLSYATSALAVGMLIAGTVSETVGRRPVMTAAVFLTSLLAVATLLCHSFASLLTLRLLQGLVLAGVPSVAMAYLGEEMDAQSIGHAMGLYISGNAVGGMTGRIGSALLCSYMPWHSAIALIGVSSLLLSCVFLLYLPASRNFHRRPFQMRYLFTSLFQHLHDRGLLCLYGLAFLSMGGFVSLYNYIGFRLLAAPYNLSQFQVSLIFLVYLLGSFSSGIVGGLIHRFGRPLMIRFALSVMLAGTLFTLSASLSLIVVGVGVFTCGFFSAHAIASSWVGRRAKAAKAQASSLYLFSYYLGSSISGTVGGLFWQGFGWHGVAAMIILLTMAALGVTALLLRMPVYE
ncbi:MAG: MFS transporter [Desulfuromonadaceae bacterium]|nr:MFS transporter [Desulfuromonadaceae bacterium]MDD5106505.1 MFS transporter [Desulfuromonadaceae bacterium]